METRPGRPSSAARENRERRTRSHSQSGDKFVKAYRYTIALGLLICVLQGLHAKEQTTCDSPMSYENHNQVEPKPFRLKTIRGVAIDEEGVSVWNLCLGLFTEKDRKLIVGIRAGEDGRFALKDIPPGEYRLVAKS